MERPRPESELVNNLKPPFDLNVEELQDLSVYLRRKVFEICVRSASGHIGGSSSSVELMTSLYFGGVLNYDPRNLHHPDRDRVLVRGHLGPLRYPILSLLGEVEDEELTTYRELGSRLQGHEEHQRLPGVDLTPSGSLGMLLSYGVGAAIASRDSGRIYKTYVFLGDGEEQEGNVSEAARHAAHLNLDNLIVILDKNKKQLSNPTSGTDNADIIKTWSGYGWNTLEIKNGHDINEILSVLEKAKEIKGPVFVVANTVKGYGLEGAEEHFSGYHTIRTCPPTIAEAAITKLNQEININEDRYDVLFNKIKQKGKDSIDARPEKLFEEITLDIQPTTNTSRNLNAAQGEYFIRLGELLKNRPADMPPIYFFTADVVRQDDVEAARLRDFAQFINVGIREQHMVAMSHGLSLSSPEARIIISSFDAFTYRSIDQLNSLSLGDGSVVIIGDIAGITNAKNGATHQAASQPGALLSMPKVTMLEPADVTDLFNCLNWSIGKSRGPVYIRVHNSSVKDLERMPIESDSRKLDYYVVKPASNKKIELTIVASGLTTGHSIEAAGILDNMGIGVQVINVINQKSLDKEFAQLFPANKPVLTVYNGEPQILQNSVARVILENGGSSLPSKIIGHGFQVGTSGSLSDLIKHYKLDAKGIVSVVFEKLIQR
ncbi:MAG TPA: 1-deoxy-D-xylulose-5-phosphate synthase N-terminal domain-containing protein [Patescibacteria group bacterium]